MNSLTNAPFPRFLPMAIWTSKLPEGQEVMIKELVNQEVMMTHPSPLVSDACFLLLTATSYLLSNIDYDKRAAGAFDEAYSMA